MKRSRVIALLVSSALIGLLVGCTSEGATDISGSGGGAELKIVYLNDGTKCVTIIGYGKAAIDCDFDAD